MANGTGTWKKNIRYDVKQPTNATVEPTERSNVPEIRSSIIPTATMVSVDRLSNICEKLLKVGNVDGKTALATAMIRTSTMVKA
jgi:hypothetical protein